MRRVGRALALAAVVLAVSAPAALAHGGNPDYRSVIDRVTPKVPNVSFQVLSYDSYFELLDQHGHEVVIYGYENEPYARMLKNGTVQVNQRSPATYLNDSRFATTQVPPIADPKAPPQWKTVDDSGTFIWHDHRMHYLSTATPPQVTDKSRKTKIFDYTIPLRVDGRRARSTAPSTGSAARRPRSCRSSSPGSWSLLGGGAAGAAGAAAARRGRRPEPDGGAGQGGLVVPRRPRRAWWRCSPWRCCRRRAPSPTPSWRAPRPSAARSSSSEPTAVIFRFDEPVEGNFGAVRVYDAEGSRVDEGDAFHPGGEGPDSASTSSRACRTAATRRPTGSSPPTATSSPAASSSRSARPGGAEGDGRRADRRPRQRTGHRDRLWHRPRRSSTRRWRSASAALAFLLFAWRPALRSSAAGARAGARPRGPSRARCGRCCSPRPRRRGQRRRRDRPRGRRGGRRLRLRRAQGVDPPRDAGDPVRHRLGPRGAGLDRLRRCSRWSLAPARARRSAAARCSLAGRSLPRAGAGALRPPQHPVAGRAASSRPTSCTSSRWRSGSAASPRCFWSLPAATRELEPPTAAGCWPPCWPASPRLPWSRSWRSCSPAWARPTSTSATSTPCSTPPTGARC